MELAEYLDDITTGNDAKINMEILINENEFIDFSSSEDVPSLNRNFINYCNSYEDIKNYLIELNKDLSEKIKFQEEIINELKQENRYLINLC